MIHFVTVNITNERRNMLLKRSIKLMCFNTRLKCIRKKASLKYIIWHSPPSCLSVSPLDSMLTIVKASRGEQWNQMHNSIIQLFSTSCFITRLLEKSNQPFVFCVLCLGSNTPRAALSHNNNIKLTAIIRTIPRRKLWLAPS
jgi:hypothetical protein